MRCRRPAPAPRQQHSPRAGPMEGPGSPLEPQSADASLEAGGHPWDTCGTPVLLAPVGCRPSSPSTELGGEFPEGLSGAEAAWPKIPTPADPWLLPGGSRTMCGGRCLTRPWTWGSSSDEVASDGGSSSGSSSLESEAEVDRAGASARGPTFIDLGHPHARLLLLLLGGRGEDGWSA
ncbi:unnamed protein product [Prorocentrum cordatum]|uniref:Uncharacterized protein n=2 Tax=Prorocentrum cordatum TaxID=2364126 RepID=A0ABN9SY41_9DINO|nr:unnamed protein product [Polarella glacialis]